MKPTPAISVQGLTKYYPPARRRWGIFSSSSRRRPAVDGVDLEIEKGQFFGLLGQNGAGKTTLIKMLSTLVLPTSGTAEVNGHNLKDERAIKRSIGIASGDERSFFWRLTGRQNLEFFAALQGIRPGDMKSRVDHLLELIGLSESADMIFRSYSTGMKQQLSIARALLHEPPILFLDEPTKGLDPLATKAFHDLFKVRLNQGRKITILMTTHRLDEAEKLCDRIAIMHEGRILARGTISDLRDAPGLADRYRVTAVEVGPAVMESIRQSMEGSKAVFVDGGGGMVRFEIADDGESLGRVIDLIRGGGGLITDIRHVTASLESIYEAIVPHRGERRGNLEERT